MPNPPPDPVRSGVSQGCRGQFGVSFNADVGVSVNADVGDHRNRPPGGETLADPLRIDLLA